MSYWESLLKVMEKNAEEEFLPRILSEQNEIGQL
jgi:hypothetical protein